VLETGSFAERYKKNYTGYDEYDDERHILSL